jgi:hypothetical protein
MSKDGNTYKTTQEQNNQLTDSPRARVTQQNRERKSTGPNIK